MYFKGEYIMNKKIIFGNSKFRLVLGILAISLMMIGCGGNSIEPIEPTEPSVEFTLTTVPDTVPVENVWVITDGGNTATKADFDKLEALLNSDAAKDRKIKLQFPNIEAIPAEAFYDRSTSTGVETIVAVSAEKALTIGDTAFTACKALTTVSFPLAESIGVSAFSACAALTDVSFPLATSIGDTAFYGCAALTDVSFPKATNIGNQAFEYCDALTSVNFPVATTIGEFAFFNCAALTTVSFPLVETIGNQVFAVCDALTDVSFPKATTIGANAFENCKALSTMKIATKSTLDILHNSAFTGVDTKKITVTTLNDANKGLLEKAGILPANITVQ